MMELTYFFTQFIPSTFSFYSSVNGARFSYQEVAEQSTPGPHYNEKGTAPSLDDVTEMIGFNLLSSNYGVKSPGFDQKVGIPASMWDIVVNNVQSVGQFLATLGIVAKAGADDMAEQVKDVIKDLSHGAYNILKNAIFSGINTDIVIPDFTPEYKEMTKNLATLLANNDIQISATVDGTGYSSEVTWSDNASFLSAINDILVENDIIVDGDNFTYQTIPGLIGNNPDTTKVNLGVVRNTINDKVVPFMTVFTYAEDADEIDNITLVYDPANNVFRVSCDYNFESGGYQFYRNDNIGDEIEAGVDTPYSKIVVEEPQQPIRYIGLFNYDVYSGSTAFLPHTLINLPVSADDEFFDGMTTEEKEDSSSYALELFVRNNLKLDDVEVFPATVDPTIGSALSDGVYDTLGSGNSADANARINEGLTNVVLPSTVGALVGTGALVDVIPAAVNVYPVDTATDKTLVYSGTELSVSDAIQAIDTANETSGASSGTADLTLASATGVYGLFTLYKMTLSQLRDLANKLWSADFKQGFNPFINDPNEALISLMAYPIDITASQTDTDIICGNFNCSPAQGKVVSNLFENKDLGSITISERFNSYLDYAPYTRIQLYLPFIGLVSLDPDEVMGATISVKYRVEYITGTCVATVKVTKGTMNAVFYQYSSNMGMQLPLSASSFSRTFGNLISSGLGLAGSIGATVASGGTLAPVALAGAGSAVAGLQNSKPNVQKSGGMSGNAGLCGNLCAYVIIDSVVPDTPQGYNTFKGRPTNKYMTVSDLSGFVQLNAYQLNLPNMTDDERNELDTILHNGFIV